MDAREEAARNRQRYLEQLHGGGASQPGYDDRGRGAGWGEERGRARGRSSPGEQGSGALRGEGSRGSVAQSEAAISNEMRKQMWR